MNELVFNQNSAVRKLVQKYGGERETAIYTKVQTTHKTKQKHKMHKIEKKHPKQEKIKK
jgi:hypothetical protein